ncbi:Oxoglutarate iron-dependent oxygenase protein [Rutstroemia sp. NJR-2017a WRK4]|nr:Oxoglutarate iron-dependent oxygenase protein [Rutstroemia sp. NJR-2017a WRK4]
MSWHCFPAEIRLTILEVLLQDGCSLADFATVSREWQTIIELHNFSRIKLRSSRLADFGSMVYRNRSVVRYIWLCLELQEYDCTECEPQMEDPDLLRLSDADNALIIKAFQDLFSELSVWEPDGRLLLDISVFSPSDSEHWFKYLAFESDIAADIWDRDQHAKQPMLVDHRHGWIAGNRNSIPTPAAIHKVFEEIMEAGPFDDEEQEGQWWQQLPLVPAVTGVLLRQQNRRRWKPAALALMFNRLPGLQEIHYEPWREWLDLQQQWTDQCQCRCVSSLFTTTAAFQLHSWLLNPLILFFFIALRLLFESLSSDRLRRLVIFENFDQTYSASYMRLGCDPVRIPSSSVSRAVANASLTLEHLSASFIVDASQFFHAWELSWKWLNLTWLALTSQLLVPQERPRELDDMLQAAAAAAMKMPNLKTMEIWNGDKGLAMLFRYQRAKQGQPAVITCRGTWELTLRPLVIQAWDSVALMHDCDGHLVIKELLEAGVCIKSHGDAISRLKLSRPVIRPVSLRQIQMEHTIREGYKPIRVMHNNPNKRPEFSIYLASGSNNNAAFILKHVHSSIFEQSQELKQEFGDIPQIRHHVDVDEGQNILVYKFAISNVLEMINDCPPLPLQARKTILKDVGLALENMHTRNWILLDVKPDDVFIDWIVNMENKFCLHKVQLGDLDCALKLIGSHLLNHER